MVGAPQRRTWLAILTLWVVAIGLSGQTETQQLDQPRPGQAGKDVEWVPTPQPLVETVLDLAGVTARDVVIDLGSGDGRTVIAAAKRGARALGIEYNPDLVALSARRAVAAGVADRARFVKADIFETDFSQASVVTMFLLPSLNLRLRPKILGMKPGTRVVSTAFDMEDWEADQVRTIPHCLEWCTALLWIVPPNVAGSWQLQQGKLTLRQKFQVVSGTFVSGGASHAVNGRLLGEQMKFVTSDAQYIGRVDGETIVGTSTSGATTSTWRASRIKP